MRIRSKVIRIQTWLQDFALSDPDTSRTYNCNANFEKVEVFLLKASFNKLEKIPTALHARNCMNFLTFLHQFSSVTSTEIVGSGSNLVLSSKVKESQTFMQEALFC